MIDNQIDLLIVQGLVISKWATKNHTELNSYPTQKDVAKMNISTASLINPSAQVRKPSAPTSPSSLAKNLTETPWVNVNRPILHFKPKQVSGKEMERLSITVPNSDILLELCPAYKALKQRATQTVANIKACVIPINSKEEAPSSKEFLENKIFQDSILAY